VPLTAIVLSYFEIRRERVLRATFGDPANL
jgi:hypothetical protein